MATFLLIHGAWHGGWSMEPLRPALEAAGHKVIAPDLPGTDSDEALARTTLATWGDFVAALARQQPEPVILCGHSRGGIVISEAAERAPEAVKALVYITAFLIPNGSSLADFAAPRTPALAAGMQIVAGGAAVTVSPEAAAATFYTRVPSDVAEAAARRLVPEPTCIRDTPLQLSEARWCSIPRYYIECSEDEMIPPENQRRMQAASPVKKVLTIACDHAPSLSDPDALAAALLEIAEIEAKS